MAGHISTVQVLLNGANRAFFRDGAGVMRDYYEGTPLVALIPSC